MKQFAVAALSLFVVAVNAHAQSPADQIFVCFEGPQAVTGTATLVGYEKCIEAQSAGYGVTSTTTIIGGGPGAGAGKAKLSPFTFTKRVDTASPSLFLAAAQGTHFPGVSVHFVRAAADKGQKSEYLTLTLKEVLVTGVNASANGGTDASTPKGVAGVSEIIELLFGALKVDAGGASSCFDSVSNSSGGLCSSNGSLAG